MSGPTPRRRTRHETLEVLRAAGIDPYPVQVPRTTSVKQAHDGARSDQAPTVSVVGRVVQLGQQDGTVRVVLREGSTELQALLTADTVEPEALELFRSTVDCADQVSVTGTTGRSDDGEPNLLVTSWTMAAKALAPPPDGSADPSTCTCMRHVELALDDDAVARLRARSAAVASVRTTLAWQSYTEVETPVLHRVPAAGTAPFRTRIDGDDQDLYLRTSPEPYLRRLVVGGLGKVFEVGRSFRNQPADADHNPELTYLDACQAYGDYTTLRVLAQTVVRTAAAAVHGAAVARRPDGTKVCLDGPDWPVVTVHDAVSQTLTTPALTPGTPLEEVRGACRQAKVTWRDDEPAGVLVTRLYEQLVVPATGPPVFYVDFPLESSPTARAHRSEPGLAERWDLVAFGTTIASACSGLADPVEQRRRTMSGDAPEALDEGLLTALDFGLPPTGSLSLGIDEMMTMLLGSTVRDILTFPFVSPPTAEPPAEPPG